MVRLTLIFRIVDGLPLAEGLDKDEMESYKGQAKVDHGDMQKCLMSLSCFP